jgi:hypothetical protein
MTTIDHDTQGLSSTVSRRLDAVVSVRTMLLALAVTALVTLAASTAIAGTVLPRLDFRVHSADNQVIVIRVSGQLDGRTVQAQLADDGRLTGSPSLVAAIDELVRYGMRVGIGGIITGAASLDEDRIARATLLAPLDHGTGRLFGDPPRVDPIPAGAQA